MPVVPPPSATKKDDENKDDNNNSIHSEKVVSSSGRTISRHESQQAFKTEKDLILLAMAVCSTVTTNKDTGAFAGESPDEVALAKAAKENGYALKSRGIDTCILDAAGDHPEWVGEFEILAQLEFTSSRRRM